ncbi:MAG: bifunctional hydroxymethylpyrimidine kinase/phosphomethylpyrimidine kinase [Thermodesulfobacteriota bacterium]|nr:bifunctional hydroxymethylpyrimidine kinase/phosphomethylpyrimidine kinase [Thermodesulfobacteriota bacterium]
MLPRVLTVAGSDSGGGAGIQADLKTIAVLGGFGMSAVTAVTAQNTCGVTGIHEIPSDFVARQMEAVISDIGVDALKTGMLINPAIIRAVCQKIRKHRLAKVVVDPVMTAKGGTRLLSPEGEEVLRRELLPLAQVIVPNLSESEALTGKKIKGLKGMREAAVQIHGLGAKNVLVKGGHLSGDPVDVFFDGRKFYDLEGIRISTPHTHGTGCTTSAAIAVELARGSSAREAVEKAKAFITRAIQFAIPLGHGQGPVNPFALAALESERYRVIQKLKKAFQTLKEKKLGYLFPEVQSNLGYALPHSRGPEDVAAFPGRFVRLGKEIVKVADPEFGASQHIAKIILTTMMYDTDMRSAMNLRFAGEILGRARKAGFSIGRFDRKDEPGWVKQREGSSLSWGVQKVLQKKKDIPDIIFDRGGMGKEPMIRVLGRDPEEVVDKVIRLS